MNKKILRPIIIIIIVLASLILLWKNLNQTSEWDSKLFSINNPQSIDKVTFIPNDESQRTLTLYKEDNIWFVKNDLGNFKADTNSVKQLIFWLMPKLRIQRPTTDEQSKFVNRQLTQFATKATFYAKGTEVQSIFVGGPTQDQLATYMFKEGTDRPCLVEIQNFNGYATPYFNTNINLWRTSQLLEVEPEDIQELAIEWPQNPEWNYKILNQDSKSPQLFYKNQTVSNANSSLLTGYLLLCSSFSRETGDIAGINRDISRKDSVINSSAIVKFNYILKNQKSISISIFDNPNYEDTEIDAKSSNTETIQTKLFWIKSSEDPNLWLTQGVLIKNKIKQYQDFIISQP